MILAFIKIIASVIAIMLIAFWLVYKINRLLKKPSTRLFSDGYILTHPKRDAIGFKNAKKANEFANRAGKESVYFDIYAVFRGRIIHCGNTINSIIT